MKGITDVLAGTVHIKSAMGGRIRSAPKMKTTSYLDPFTANIERLKLEQEQANLAKRRSQIDARMEQNQRRLAEISAQMQMIAQSVSEEENKKSPVSQRGRRVPPKKWRTMPAHY